MANDIFSKNDILHIHHNALLEKHLFHIMLKFQESNNYNSYYKHIF